MAFSDDLSSRQYVDQYGIEDVGMIIHVNGVPDDPDGSVQVVMKDLEDTTTYFTRTADHHPAIIGTFETTLQSTDTETPGIYKLEWTYVLGGEPQIFVGLLEVGASSPAYSSLAPEMQAVVEATWIRFADMFDSPFGGPHLQVYFQAHFTRNRMGQLLRLAVGTMNTIAQPYSSFSVDGEPPFPVEQWGPLLERGLYIETVKHLIRSYLEQPDAANVTLSRLDRRDYFNRWQEILAMEEDEFKRQLSNFKMSQMHLGRPRVLVSGGVYGTFGPTRLPYSAAARPRYWYQFH